MSARRSAQDDLVGQRRVTECGVDGAHRRVADVVLGLQRVDTRCRRPTRWRPASARRRCRDRGTPASHPSCRATPSSDPRREHTGSRSPAISSPTSAMKIASRRAIGPSTSYATHSSNVPGRVRHVRAGDVARRRVGDDVERLEQVGPLRQRRDLDARGRVDRPHLSASARRAPASASARTPRNRAARSHPIASGRASHAGTCSATFPIAAAWMEMRRYSSPPMPRRRKSSTTPISPQAPSKSGAYT